MRSSENRITKKTVESLCLLRLRDGLQKLQARCDCLCSLKGIEGGLHPQCAVGDPKMKMLDIWGGTKLDADYFRVFGGDFLTKGSHKRLPQKRGESWRET